MISEAVGHWLAFVTVPLVLFVIGIAMERRLIRFFYAARTPTRSW